jgi:hypothetical protein
VSGHTRERDYAHLRACEEALLDPSVRRDRARVGALLAEDFQEYGSSGRVWSREEIIESLASEERTRFAMEDFKCDWIAESIALVTYRSVRTDAQSGAQSIALRSSLWVNKSGDWRMRFHQGTKVQ